MRKTIRLERLRLAGAVIAAATAWAVAPAHAEPRWFEGKPKDALTAAKQNNKGLVLYFESERAEECVKMRAEVWPKIDADKAGQKFLWMKVQPGAGDDFFAYYSVYQTPEIVILDSAAQEQSRIKGFTEASLLMDMVGQVQAGDKKANVVMLPNGKTINMADYKKGEDARKAMEKETHLYYESFDKTAKFDDLPQPMWKCVRGAYSLRVEPGLGAYGTNALYVGADPKPGVTPDVYPAALVRIDLTEKLAAAEAVEARVSVRVKARVVKMPDKTTECMRLVVQNPTDPPPMIDQSKYPADAKKYDQTLFARNSGWDDNKSLVSEPYALKARKTYLLMWVNEVTQAFVVDDLRVDVLAADAKITIANSGGRELAATLPNPLLLCAPLNLYSDVMWNGLDVNKDGRISHDEIPANNQLLNDWFMKADKNHDGFVDQGE